MLEDERTALVLMALHALLLPETAEQAARDGGVRIVARRAFEGAFDQAMPFVQRERGQYVVMTVGTQRGRSAEPLVTGIDAGGPAQQRGGCRCGMLCVAARATQSRLRMRAHVEFRVGRRVAVLADLGLSHRRLVAKGEYVAAAARRDVHADVAVAIDAAGRIAGALAPLGRIDHAVRIRLQSFVLIGVADAADRFGRIRLRGSRLGERLLPGKDRRSQHKYE